LAQLSKNTHYAKVSLRGGDDAPFKKMERYLSNGAARGGQTIPATKEVFDLPSGAEL
jgi:hypothetical protein